MSMKVMEEMVTVLMFEGVQLSEDTYYVKNYSFLESTPMICTHKQLIEPLTIFYELFHSLKNVVSIQ